MAFEGLTPADIDRVFSLPEVKKMHIFAPLKNLETTDPWENIVLENFPNLHPQVRMGVDIAAPS